jgi:hypothetical protein
VTLIEGILVSLILPAVGVPVINATGIGHDQAIDVPLTSCGSLRQPNATYVLRRNVQSLGTCFSIEANNITLDLGGHTVTYGISVSSHASFGILAADCWDHEIDGNSCGGTHKYPTIMNGRIVQGAHAAPKSHALRFGQANSLTGVKVHHLDITISSPDSIAIFGEYLPGGSDLYANTIHNNVTAISSRYQFNGASIKLGEEIDAKLPDLIHNNVIVGGAQLGIRDDNSRGSKIYENDISQDASYTNGFCIDAAGAGMQVYRNICHPIHGRGIHANRSDIQIFDNVIETVDNNNNVEYKGCEINGTYGIQVESDGFAPTNISIFKNRVTVHAAQCPAEAMRLTEIEDGDIQIHDNVFIAVQDKIEGGFSEEGARVFSVGETHGNKLRIFGNTARADSAIFHMDWDGGDGFTLNNNTFEAGRKGHGTLLADFENGVNPSYDNYFLDNTYDGFSPDSAHFGEYAKNSWYGVTESVRIHVVDHNGRQMQDLHGIILDSSEKVLHQGDYDGHGNFTFVLPVMRVESKRSVQKYAAYDLTITGGKCLSYETIIPSLKLKAMSLTLSCP